MATMKMFTKWLIIFILFFIFVEYMSYAYIASAYQDKMYVVKEQEPKITVTECKATYVNGYVKGTVTNTTSEYIGEIYVRVECYSSYNNNIGSVYCYVNDLKPNETKEFTIKYRYQKVESLMVFYSKNHPEETAINGNEAAQITKKDNDSFVYLVAAITFLFFFG